jgi:mono/diheme cytochrome c family protein
MIISALFLITGVWLFFLLGGIKMFHIIKLVFVFTAIPMAVIGFKKHKKGLALLSLILIIGAYGMGEMSKNKPFIPAKVVLSGDSASPGAMLYQANCAFCHGKDGSKQYRAATDLRRSTSNESVIQMMIKDGSKGKMPAYKETLSDAEISDISLYVFSLRSGTE